MKKKESLSCDISTKGSCCGGPVETEKKDYKKHWNTAYERADVEKLGWYEEHPEPSLRLIEKCGLNSHSYILNAGAGATTLVDELLSMNYENIIVNDISSVALDRLKQRLGAKGDRINWVEDDLTNPVKLNDLEKIDLWHDRAVLHFFNEAEDQDTYFELVRNLVKSGGHVIIATFNLDGAEKCSGLPVFRYNKSMIQDGLGTDFELIEAFDYIYTMPSGDTRSYVYTLFKKK